MGGMPAYGAGYSGMGRHDSRTFVLLDKHNRQCQGWQYFDMR